jgi:hypothetical protein
MWYGYLADLIVAAHVGYVAFVIVGQLLILVGLLFRWGWVRNVWFRGLHLLAIAIVAAESVVNFQCPLTVWEDDLRHLAGQKVAEGTFIGRMLHNLLVFDDLPFNHWAFRASYIGFAVLVLGTFILAPPRRKKRAKPAPLPDRPCPTEPAAKISPSGEPLSPGLRL